MPSKSLKDDRIFLKIGKLVFYYLFIYRQLTFPESVTIFKGERVDFTCLLIDVIKREMKVKFHTLQFYLFKFYDRKKKLILNCGFRLPASLAPTIRAITTDTPDPCFLSYFPNLQQHFKGKPKHLAFQHRSVSGTQYTLLLDSLCDHYLLFQHKAYRQVIC